VHDQEESDDKAVFTVEELRERDRAREGKKREKKEGRARTVNQRADIKKGGSQPLTSWKGT
jgi:hypothetical protein